MSTPASSFSEATAYPAFCERAARVDAAFRTFKRDPVYNQILEHVTEDEGRRYLRSIVWRDADWSRDLSRFRFNDRLGNPRTYAYGAHGTFSPTTLRYVKVLADLRHFFDAMGPRIVEIGVGYGGQCAVLSLDHPFDSYTLVDLPPVLELAGRYLDASGVRNVRQLPPEQIEARVSCDLLISNFAFSELSRVVQDRYFETLVAGAARGYMTLNSFQFDNAYSRAEIEARVPGSVLVDETPFRAPGVSVLLWDRTQRPVAFRARALAEQAHARLHNLPHFARYGVDQARARLRSVASSLRRAAVG